MVVVHLNLKISRSGISSSGEFFVYLCLVNNCYSLRVYIVMGRLKTRDWKTRHQTAELENAGKGIYGKPNGVIRM